MTKLKKACHGLVDAPLEWFLKVSEYLVSIGFTRCVTDPHAALSMPTLKGISWDMISGHVDDFLFCGREECAEWKQLCDNIRNTFKWGTWEQDQFVQCGVRIERTPDGGFELSQSHSISMRSRRFAFLQKDVGSQRL